MIKKLRQMPNRESGFSLVEMAIVFVIIGLIVSAIAVGRTTMRKGESIKAYQQFINPWTQSALNYYQNTGLTGWGSIEDLKNAYPIAGGQLGQGEITLQAGNGIQRLTISFTNSTIGTDAWEELTGTFLNAMSAAQSTSANNEILAASFDVPSVVQNP
ncbi:MAG: prepilin-type N-terminal cleavage/methylation domain-containing protein [Magnetococcales bacterium]|nr:prepilin-type N-terminal cleavage/methylation domain-containing protein [Magnetococcales bacterium]